MKNRWFLRVAVLWLLLIPARLRAGNLAALYHLDAGSGAVIMDSSGNGNTGCFPSIYNVSTCFGPALGAGADDPLWTTAAGAKFGNSSLSFDMDDLVIVPDSLSLHLTTGMTLEAWFKPAAGAAGSNIVAKWSFPSSQSYALGVGACGGGKFFLGATLSTNGSNEFQATGPCNITAGDGRWHHAAATFTSGTPGTLTVYLDGVPVGSTSAMGAGTIFVSTAPMTIGADNVPSHPGRSRAASTKCASGAAP